MSLRVEETPVTVAELVAAISRQRQFSWEAPIPPPAPALVSEVLHGSPRNATARSSSRGSAGVVVVVGAHPGAGASLVSVALADALAYVQAHAQARVGRGQVPVRLVDAAPQETSGLICAAGRELGINERGWRIGRRGDIEIHRLPDDGAAGGLPEIVEAFDSGYVVVDLGWPGDGLRESINRARHLWRQVEVVVVCRASVPGTRRAEHALTELPELPGRTVVACVGARRLPGAVQASLGPLMSAASDPERMVLVPPDRRIEVTGIDAEPLPKAIQSCGTRLAGLIWPGDHAAEGQQTEVRA